MRHGEPERPQMTTRRMRCACRTTKAKNTHSEYVIIIVFPRQQSLRERISMLRYSTLCLVKDWPKPIQYENVKFLGRSLSFPSLCPIDSKDHKNTMHKTTSVRRCFVATQP
jgi:hypothetical protein